MIRFSAQIVNQARRLAKTGLTYREIGKQLEIDDSNIAIWCRNFSSNNPRKLIKILEHKRNIVKQTDSRILKTVDFNTNLNKIVCSIIYGCEGAKYPATNCVALTNSDPYLVATFINLFRKSFRIEDSKFRAYLQIHSNQNYPMLLNYWSNCLDISIDNFYKPVVTKAGGNKHRHDYLGTCTVKYYDYRLQLRLIGIYEEYMRKFAKLEDMPSG